MKIVQMIGGLGNQMFQYALYRNLFNYNDDVKYEGIHTRLYHNGFELEKVFNIVARPIENIVEVDNLTRFQENTWPGFNPAVLTMDDVYLCGNWQNPAYFPDEEILRRNFTFKQYLDPRNQEVLKDIQSSNSVSIHVRRGDYTNVNHINYFFQPNWLNYYGSAIAYIAHNEKSRPLKFFVFSDDISWCKKNMSVDVTYVENVSMDSWKDMQLMSNCKHNIIANSTFSWWAAWLNKNPNKIVTTPKNWFYDQSINPKLVILDHLVKI